MGSLKEESGMKDLLEGSTDQRRRLEQRQDGSFCMAFKDTPVVNQSNNSI